MENQEETDIRLFISNFIRDRTSIYEKIVDIHDKIQKSYFSESYSPFNVQKSLAASKSEVILSVQKKGETAEVLTTGGYGLAKNWRYVLRFEHNRWHIKEITFECEACNGTGILRGVQCRLCKGLGRQLLPNLK